MLYHESKYRSHIQLGARYCAVGHSNQQVALFASLFDHAVDARSMYVVPNVSSNPISRLSVPGEFGALW